MNDPPSVLVVGDLADPGMLPVGEALRHELPAGAAVRRVERLSEALDEASRMGRLPEIAVVCQRHPDEFPARDVLQALGRFPLTRWVVCLGAWCESALRTGIAWPVSVCVPARTCRERIAAEAAVAAGRRAPLPLTAGRDEAFAFDADGEALQRVSGTISLAAGIVSPDRAFAEWLAHSCRAAGIAAAIIDPDVDRAVDFLVWDADPWRADALRKIEAARTRFPQADLVAVMTMPHPEDVDALTKLGAVAVISRLAAPTALREVVAERR